MTSTMEVCSRCQRQFSSKTFLFQHLRTLEDTCLSLDEHAILIQKDVERDVVKAKNTKTLEKIAILYGYIASEQVLDQQTPTSSVVLNGDHASLLVVQAIYHLAKFGRRATTTKLEVKLDSTTPIHHRRSYGCVQRNKLLAQETGCGAITEVLSMRAPPLNGTLDEWTRDVNLILEQLVSNGKIQVFGRLTVHPKFDAEENAMYRRFEYVLPVDFLFDNPDHIPGHGIQPPPYLYQPSGSSTTSQQEDVLRNFFSLFPCFTPSQPLVLIEDYYAAIQTPSPTPDHVSNKVVMVKYFFQLKKLMQSMTTGGVPKDPLHSSNQNNEDSHLNGADMMMMMDREEDEMEDLNQQDSVELQDHKRIKSGLGSSSLENPPLPDSTEKNIKAKKKTEHRHYHNFTEHGMAHEEIVYRKMDRFYHRSTIRAVSLDSSSLPISISLDNSPKNRDLHSNRPFIVFSLKGDSLLTGQVRGMIGLYVAIVRGYISKDIIECMLDPEYSNLVTAPFIPTVGMIAGEAMYSTWEGKMDLVLSPRRCNRYKAGWNDAGILENVSKFQEELYKHAIQAWYAKGTHSDDGRLNWERDWIREHLIPWSKRAQQQLADYQQWKQTKEEKSISMTNKLADDFDINTPLLLPPISSIDTRIPALYEAVLYHLRKVNNSGFWPTTTAKRQLVMVSTDSSGNSTSSIVEARIRASSNQVVQSSAYSFNEGKGGASGSFTVGVMPGDRCEQPKSNSSFPELMKAAFELEIALCPDREPSSTIAINRNAQFRPHVDVGAGAGQSTSLIVGLGDYVGGELMVEGTTHDIRYKPLEFNGWKQRHWTLPFNGERFSLVWFTPKGCDGIHGIDLCR